GGRQRGRPASADAAALDVLPGGRRMTLMKSRPIVSAAGAAVLVALLVIARPVLNPTAVPAPQSSNPSATTTSPPPVVPVVDLNLDRLRAVGGRLRESERDPCRSRPKPPPPVARVQPPPAPYIPPGPTGPPPPPPIPLKYFAFVSLNGQKTASFLDARGNTFSAKEGDVLE